MPSGCTILAVALGDRGHGTASMCRIECRGARAVGSACGGSQSAAQTHRAGADCPGLGRSAPGAAGGAKYRRQPADGVAMVTALCRERDRRPAARQDPQARQGTDRGGNRSAGSWRWPAPSRRTKQLTGPAGRWPKPSASRWVRCSASGRRTNCSRTSYAPSRARAIPALPTSSPLSSGSMLY